MPAQASGLHGAGIVTSYTARGILMATGRVYVDIVTESLPTSEFNKALC